MGGPAALLYHNCGNHVVNPHRSAFLCLLSGVGKQASTAFYADNCAQCNVPMTSQVMASFASGVFSDCVLTTATTTATTSATTTPTATTATTSATTTPTAVYCADKLDAKECDDVTSEECGNPL